MANLVGQTQTAPPPPSQLPLLDDAGKSSLFLGARTVSNFSDRPVTDRELREIWALAKWPPTSANTQPLRVLYVRTPEARERLIPHLNENDRAMTRSAPAVAVLAADMHFHEHFPALNPADPDFKERLASDEERRPAQARFNATLQAGYFLLAVRAVGLAAGPIGGFDPAGVDGEFFPNGRWQSLLVVNIGHPGVNPWRDRPPRLDDRVVLDWV
ncbi:MAG: malonic semialdehyde reductase [Acidimicrobiaceae bacterium]|nr:malonic semialdehyde reductase [Acidimicrobiaceae bacterium]